MGWYCIIQRSLRAHVCQHIECNFTHFSMCVIFFVLSALLVTLQGVSLYVDSFCLCAVSVFLRIFVAKDKILACKMFEIKSDRWHGIFFVLEIFLNQFFSLFNCIKVSFFGNFLSFCKTWLFFTQLFLLLGLTFISKFLGF